MEENNTKEINLLQLLSLVFAWIGKGLRKGLDFFVYVIRNVYKHWFLYAVLVFACGGVGVFLARDSAKVYKAEGLALLYGCDAQTVREISRELENSNPNSKITSLATKLGLPDSIAKNIVGFHSYYVIDYMKDGVGDKIDFTDNHSLADTSNVRMKDRLYMQLLIKRINQAPKIQQAILNYFNSNHLMNVHLQSSRNEMAQNIKVASSEFSRIDSMAKVNYFEAKMQQLRLDKDKILLGEQQKQLFYNDLMRLQSIKSSNETNLAIYTTPVNLPAGLVVNPVPVNGRFKYALTGIIYGFIFAFLLSVFIDKRKMIFAFLKNN